MLSQGEALRRQAQSEAQSHAHVEASARREFEKEKQRREERHQRKRCHSACTSAVLAANAAADTACEAVELAVVAATEACVKLHARAAAKEQEALEAAKVQAMAAQAAATAASAASEQASFVTGSDLLMVLTQAKAQAQAQSATTLATTQFPNARILNPFTAQPFDSMSLDLDPVTASPAINHKPLCHVQLDRPTIPSGRRRQTRWRNGCSSSTQNKGGVSATVSLAVAELWSVDENEHDDAVLVMSSMRLSQSGMLRLRESATTGRERNASDIDSKSRQIRPYLANDDEEEDDGATGDSESCDDTEADDYRSSFTSLRSSDSGCDISRECRPSTDGSVGVSDSEDGTGASEEDAGVVSDSDLTGESDGGGSDSTGSSIVDTDEDDIEARMSVYWGDHHHDMEGNNDDGMRPSDLHRHASLQLRRCRFAVTAAAQIAQAAAGDACVAVAETLVVVEDADVGHGRSLLEISLSMGSSDDDDDDDGVRCGSGDHHCRQPDYNIARRQAQLRDQLRQQALSPLWTARSGTMSTPSALATLACQSKDQDGEDKNAHRERETKRVKSTKTTKRTKQRRSLRRLLKQASFNSCFGNMADCTCTSTGLDTHADDVTLDEHNEAAERRWRTKRQRYHDHRRPWAEEHPTIIDETGNGAGGLGAGRRASQSHNPTAKIIEYASGAAPHEP
jgi:hypothetical protein